MTLEPPDAFESTARIMLESRRHVVFEDADGYSMWALDRDDDAPIATFPRTEEGLEDAILRWDAIRRRERRGVLLTGLAWLVGGTGALWIAFALFVLVFGLTSSLHDEVERNESLSWFLSFYSYTLFQVLPTAFLASLGIYVVVWMHFRRGDP